MCCHDKHYLLKSWFKAISKITNSNQEPLGVVIRLFFFFSRPLLDQTQAAAMTEWQMMQPFIQTMFFESKTCLFKYETCSNVLKKKSNHQVRLFKIKQKNKKINKWTIKQYNSERQCLCTVSSTLITPVNTAEYVTPYQTTTKTVTACC